MNGKVGTCAGGTESCANGAWGACSIQPAGSDSCAPGNDDNCNGTKNEGCSCIDGATMNCGTCNDGTQTCSNGQWGQCMGAQQVGQACGPCNDGVVVCGGGFAFRRLPPFHCPPGWSSGGNCTFSQSNSIDLQDNCNLQPQNFNGGLSVPFNTYGGSLSVTLESDWAGGGCVSDGNEGLHAACSSQPADWTNAQAGTPAVHTGQQHSGAFGSSCSFSRPTCWTPWQQMTCHRTASAEIDRDRRVRCY